MIACRRSMWIAAVVLLVMDGPAASVLAASSWYCHSRLVDLMSAERTSEE